MRNYLYALVFCCFCTTACNQDKIRRLEADKQQLEGERRDLVAKLASANLDLQDKCSKQARIEFVLNYKSLPLATFTNHYNLKLNKCFMVLHTMEFKAGVGMTNSNIIVIDAFETKEFAHHFWRADKDDKKGQITRCDAIGSDGVSKSCHSMDEFNQLIKYYMDE